MSSADFKFTLAGKIVYSGLVSLIVMFLSFGVFSKLINDTQDKFDEIVNIEAKKVALATSLENDFQRLRLQEKNILLSDSLGENTDEFIMEMNLLKLKISNNLQLLKSKISYQFVEIATIENNYEQYSDSLENIEKLARQKQFKEAFSQSQKMKINFRTIITLLGEIEEYQYQKINNMELEFDSLVNQAYKISIALFIFLMIFLFVITRYLYKYTNTKMGNIDKKLKILQSNNFDNIECTYQNLEDSTEFDKIEKTITNTILLLADFQKKQKLDQKNKESKIELANLLLEKSSVEEVCDFVCEFVVARTNGVMSAIYLQEVGANVLTLRGSYCVEQTQKTFAINDGIVGQVARVKEKIFVSIDNNEHLLISGTTKTSIKDIYAFPIIFNKIFYGVFEISGNFIINEFELDLINSSLTTLGYSISNYRKINEISFLLQKNEEQQVELEQTNEILIKNNEDLRTARFDLIDNNQKLAIAFEEINQKAKTLEEVDKYKSQFLANVSHELRTPLNSINILSRILSQNKDENLTAKQVNQLLAISRSGEDLLQLINDVLDFSKLEAKMMSLDLQILNPKDIVESLFDSFVEVMKEKEIHFELKVCEDDVGFINSDKEKIRQIIKNFISNSMKFTEKGGNVCIFLEFDKQSDKPIVIGVQDSGIGIDENKLSHIFLAFTQADGSTNRKYGGTGLGLSISKSLAELVEGEITVQSEKGKGSTFSLRLPKNFDENTDFSTPKNESKDDPKDEFEDSQISHPIEVLKSKKSDKSILLIEDDEHYSYIIKREIDKLGFDCILATNGKDGIEMAKKFMPDAIMLDLTLPVIDGENVLKVLKNDLSLRHIPVKIVSASVKNIALVSSGAIEFLEKTSDPSVLENAINGLLDFASKEKKHILIVEDDIQMHQKLREIVNGVDVEVFFASTYKDATKELKNNKFDCIVVNITIRSFNAFKLLELIKKLHCEVPIVAYSSMNFTPEQHSKIRQYSRHIVIKTAENDANLVEETSLFLHRFYDKLTNQQKFLLNESFNTFDILNGKTILVVDDDARNIFALDSVFDNYRMKVLHAYNGLEALNVLDRNQNVSIVIMDIMMPIMNGYEAIQKIRQNGQYDNLPIIALTAKTDKDDRQKCIDAGASDYVTKPLDVNQLLQLLKIWLRGN